MILDLIYQLKYGWDVQLPSLKGGFVPDLIDGDNGMMVGAAATVNGSQDEIALSVHLPRLLISNWHSS